MTSFRDMPQTTSALAATSQPVGALFLLCHIPLRDARCPSISDRNAAGISVGVSLLRVGHCGQCVSEVPAAIAPAHMVLRTWTRSTGKHRTIEEDLTHDRMAVAKGSNFLSIDSTALLLLTIISDSIIVAPIRHFFIQFVIIARYLSPVPDAGMDKEPASEASAYLPICKTSRHA
jgi:hypothetical protein